MKLLISLISVVILFTSMASATENLSHVSCIYFHRGTDWEYFGYQSSDKFDLKDGESKMLVGAWTTDRPSPPNYAICTAITGTNNINLVRMHQFKFEGKVIDGVFDDCVVKGTDVNQAAEQNIDLVRGSYSEIESEWLISPAPRKISVRTYIPTLDEVDKLKEIADKKCLDLLP